jgi:hypothetical protein
LKYHWLEFANSIRALTLHVEEVCRLLSHSSEQPPAFV